MPASDPGAAAKRTMNPKKSLAERELNNNPGNRPMTVVQRVAPGEPDVPEYILHSTLAMQEWFRIVSILGQEDRLTQFDGGQISAACMSYEVMVRAYVAFGGNILVDNGRTGGDDGRGGLVKNPALQIFRDGKDSYERACNSLGVNAGAREVAKADPNEDPHGQLT